MEGKIELKPIFLKTKNVRDFEALMSGITRDAGEGRLACIYGRAGRGKTRTAQVWHAHNLKSIYIRVLTIWSGSERAFLQALCRALDVKQVPYLKDKCFTEIAARLTENPAPVILDEAEKLPNKFLGVIRDLTDITGAPMIMIGEEEIKDWMARERRVWSRTAAMMEFLPIGGIDIIQYAKEAAGVALPADAAEILYKNSGGDFRIVKRDFGLLVRMANARKTGEINAEMAREAVKAGLKPGA